MVQHRDVHDVPCLYKSFRYFDIFPARCWVAGRVVVEDYDTGGVFPASGFRTTEAERLPMEIVSIPMI